MSLESCVSSTLLCVCVCVCFLVGCDPDIVFKMIISGDGDQTGKEDMTVIQEMITTLQVNCSINQGHCTSSFYDFFSVCESWKPWDGEEGMHDPVDQDGQVLSITKSYLFFFLNQNLSEVALLVD